MEPPGREAAPPRGPVTEACDATAVCVDECAEKGRFLRLARAVRCGEAFLVEEPLFLSPAGDGALGELLTALCDEAALAAAAAARGAGAAAGPGAAAAPPAAASWLPVPWRLTLVVVRARLAEPGSWGCRALGELRGDRARWASGAEGLWSLLREDIRECLSLEALGSIYAVVAMNAHTMSDGRAGLFHMCSLAEHNCAPNSFKEAFLPSSGPAGQPRSAAGPVGGAQLVLRAQRDLAEGDPVRISYVPEYLPTWRRRGLLQAGYGFLCGCDRCRWEPEAACAYLCPRCGDGPCSPSAPLAAAGELRGHSLGCEACGAVTTEEECLEERSAAELSEVVSAESMRVLHPFHHKVVGMYLGRLKDLPAAARVQIAEQLMEAQCRLSKSESHPLLGKLAELAARAHLELGDAGAAAAGFRDAEALFALSHRGPPDLGHAERCGRQRVAAAGAAAGRPPERPLPEGAAAEAP